MKFTRKAPPLAALAIGAWLVTAGCGPRFNSSASQSTVSGSAPVSALYQWAVQDGKSSGTPGTVSLSGLGSPTAIDSAGNVYITGSVATKLDGQTQHGTQDFFISKYNSSGTLLWTVEDGAAGATVTATGVALDSTGSNVYVVANTNTALDGQTLYGSQDLIITKYNSSGVRQWTVEDGAASAYVQAGGIAVDSSGNIYAAGLVGHAALDGQTLHGQQDLIITKYNSAGVRLWTAEDGTAGADVGISSNFVAISLDSAGDVYAATDYLGSGLDGQSNHGLVDLILTKYNPSGARQWTVEDGGAYPALTMPTGVVVDGGGNAYVAAFEMYGGLDGQTLYGATDLIITKYNSSGVRQWTTEDGAAGAWVQTAGIALDSTGSNVYISASTTKALDLQTLHGTRDLILTKYSSAGARQWTVEDGAVGAAVAAGQVVMDSSNNAYVAGSTTGASIDAQTLIGNQDLIFTKYSSAGARQWTVDDGSATGRGTTTVTDSVVDSFGNTYVTGTTNSALDGQTLHGKLDFFISKYNSSGVLQWTAEDGVAGSSAINQTPEQVSVDSGGNVYVLGSVQVTGLDGQSLQGTCDFFITKYNSSGVHQWTVEDGAAGDWVSPTGIALDLSGNVYVSASTNKALDGQTLIGNTDFILTKYNSAGIRQWTVEDGGAGGAVSGGYVVTDASNNVYVGAGTNVAIDGQTKHGTEDLFITKYSSAGVLQWTVEDGAAGASVGSAGIALDSTGDIYVTGSVTGAAIDGQMLHGTQDFILTKYSSAGVRQWTVEDGAAGATVTPTGVALDPSGDIHVVGSTPAALDAQAFQGVSDIFITKYDSTGAWLSTLLDDGGTASANLSPKGIGFDSSGNLYVGGTASTSVDGQTQQGFRDLFIIKY